MSAPSCYKAAYATKDVVMCQYATLEEIEAHLSESVTTAFHAVEFALQFPPAFRKWNQLLFPGPLVLNNDDFVKELHVEITKEAMRMMRKYKLDLDDFVKKMEELNSTTEIKEFWIEKCLDKQRTDKLYQLSKQPDAKSLYGMWKRYDALSLANMKIETWSAECKEEKKLIAENVEKYEKILQDVRHSLGCMTAAQVLWRHMPDSASRTVQIGLTLDKFKMHSFTAPASMMMLLKKNSPPDHWCRTQTDAAIEK